MGSYFFEIKLGVFALYFNAIIILMIILLEESNER